MSAFPPCPLCWATEGFDLEVYIPVTPGDAPGTFSLGHGGSGLRCHKCGEDVTAAGLEEPDDPFLRALHDVAEYSTAREALHDGASNITTLRWEDDE